MSSGVRNALNCSFGACRSNICKCWHFIICYKPQNILTATDQQYHILCLGLSGSGKSTLLAQLVGDLPSSTVNGHSNGLVIKPTNGFNHKTLPFDGTVLSIKELGGSDEIRAFWSHYYDKKHALLYVIDISVPDSSLQDSMRTLAEILKHPSFACKPCLVIGTHSDSLEARSSAQVHEYLNTHLARHKNWKLVCCSSLDRLAILEAFHLFTRQIINVYPSPSKLVID